MDKPTYLYRAKELGRLLIASHPKLFTVEDEKGVPGDPKANPKDSNIIAAVHLLAESVELLSKDKPLPTSSTRSFRGPAWMEFYPDILKELDAALAILAEEIGAHLLVLPKIVSINIFGQPTFLFKVCVYPVDYALRLRQLNSFVKDYWSKRPDEIKQRMSFAVAYYVAGEWRLPT